PRGRPRGSPGRHGSLLSGLETPGGIAQRRARRRLARARRSLHNDAVRPLHQRDKNRGTSELRPPLRQIAFRDPTGSGASPSSKQGHPFSSSLSSVAPRGGHPTGKIAFAVALRKSDVASASKKIRTWCPASASSKPCEKGNAARVGSSGPQAPFIRIFSCFFVSSAFTKRKNGRPASCARTLRRAIASSVNPSAEWPRLYSGFRAVPSPGHLRSPRLTVYDVVHGQAEKQPSAGEGATSLSDREAPQTLAA